MIELLITAGIAAVLLGIWLFVQLYIGRDARSVSGQDRVKLNRLFTKAQADEFSSDTDEESTALAQEIKYTLLEERATAGDEPKQRTMARWVQFTIPLGVPLLALAIYWFWLGDPLAVDLDRIPRDFLETESMEQQQEIYSLFQKRAADQPSDGSAWFYLMQLQWITKKYDALIVSHTQAEELGHIANDSDQWFLLSVASLQRPLDNPRTIRVLERVAKSNTDLPLLIEMMLYRLAIDQMDYSQAFLVSEQILTKPLMADVRGIIETSRDTNVVPQLMQQGSVVLVMVTVPADLIDQGWLSILARSEGGGPPLAVVRRPLLSGDATRLVKVILNDSIAMQPTLQLSNFESVKIEARITESAAVAAEDAIFRVESEYVNPSDNPLVQLEFDLSEVTSDAQREEDF